MSQKTHNAIILIFAICAALLILITGGTLIAALWTGRTTIPGGIAVTMWGLLITAMTGAGPFIAAQLANRRSDQNQITTQNAIQASAESVKDRVQQTETKLQNGLGTQIAETTAQKVAEQIIPAVVAEHDKTRTEATATAVVAANQAATQAVNIQANATEANTAATVENTQALKEATP